MAKVSTNPSAGTIEGKVGDLVHYRWLVEPCVRRTPSRTKPFTESELRNQRRWAAAAVFAKGVLTDARQRARYEAAVSGTRLSAHNMAMSDFMHKPVVTEMDLGRYTGRAHEFIKI